MLHAHIMLWSLYRKYIAISIMLVSIMLICMQIFAKTYNFKCLQDIQPNPRTLGVIVWYAICTLQAANKVKLLIKPIRLSFALSS